VIFLIALLNKLNLIMENIIMKPIKTILAAVVATSTLLIANVQADELMDIIHPESADLFDHSTSINASGTTGIFHGNDINTSAGLVWSYEYEEYVSPADFIPALQPTSVAQAQKMIQDNPTAAGSVNQREVLTWDEVAHEFYLQ
jgi:hypothetical protein